MDYNQQHNIWYQQSQSEFQYHQYFTWWGKCAAMNVLDRNINSCINMNRDQAEMRTPSRDLTDVTLVSEDESCLLMKLVYLWKMYIDESCALMKVVYWWNLSIYESCILMKAVHWWRLSIYESCLLMKVAYWWKLLMEIVYWWKLLMKIVFW